MLKLYQDASEQVVSKVTQEEKSTLFIPGGNKIYFISLGCPRNLVDTEVMLGILLKAGYETVEALEEADYIVINTCAFLKASRDESLSAIEESMVHRKKGAKVVVTGCMVQLHDADIKKVFPNVDYLLGSGDVEGILRAVRASEQGTEITSARSYLEAGEVPRQVSTPKHYAYLKIAEGCRKRCAYCSIPSIKGPLKSKPVEQIIKEFRILRNQGVKEIILIAQDLGDWGKDKGYKRTEGLLLLIQEILKEQGDFYLRLLYLYPDEITHSLIKLMKSDPRICPYLDMPLQHINNTVLKNMHRATSREQIIETIRLLRMEIPNISIRTSLIVGFPGETEEQFQELVTFIKEYPLDHIGIFKYSQEEGTPAAILPDQIPEKIKEQRLRRLAKEQQKVLKKVLTKMIGTRLPVVVESYHPESPLLMRGRHLGQCPEIDSEVIINDTEGVDSFGVWYDVEITDISGYDLIGRVIGKSSIADKSNKSNNVKCTKSNGE